MINQSTRRRIPKKDQLKGKYDNVGVKKLRFKANKEFLPASSQGNNNSISNFTPIDRNFSMFRQSEAPFSLKTIKHNHPSPKGMNESDASVRDGLLPPTPAAARHGESGAALMNDLEKSNVIYVLPEVSANMREEPDPKIVVEMAKHFDKSNTNQTRKTLEFQDDLHSRRHHLRESLGIDSDDVEIVVEEQKVVINPDGQGMYLDESEMEDYESAKKRLSERSRSRRSSQRQSRISERYSKISEMNPISEDYDDEDDENDGKKKIRNRSPA